LLRACKHGEEQIGKSAQIVSLGREGHGTEIPLWQSDLLTEN